MRLTTPQIVWHSKQPVFTADFHRNGPRWRLATGGADNDIKMWKIKNEDDGVKIVFLSNLSRHTKAVNVVRFSPNGKYLASAGDDNVVFLWSQEVGGEGTGNNLLSDTANKESWNVVKILRGHLEDVYDLCWSCDSLNIITGSVDNSAIIWDVQNGKQVSVLKDSRQYVQGVSWDPLGKVVTTLSNDRNLRIYAADKFKCLHSISKMSSQISTQTDGDSRQWRMWVDEGLNSFFRRLTFTPDGLFLIVPAGRYEAAGQSKNATYIFSRDNWTRPVLQLPAPEKPTVVAKCCPVHFELKLKPESSLTSLNYRLVYAVATLDSILLYDTQHAAPFAHISNIHYSAITDLAWSNDGLMLVVTSSDCYCSIICFEPNELGVPLESSVTLLQESSPPSSEDMECSTDNQAKQSNNTPVATQVAAELISPSKQRRIRPTLISTIPSEPASDNIQTGKVEHQDIQLEHPVETNTQAPVKTNTQTGKVVETVTKETGNIITNKKTPRRVELITLSSFKSTTGTTDTDSAVK